MNTEYACDRCGADSPDGHGYYIQNGASADRVCRECYDTYRDWVRVRLVLGR